MKLKLGQIWISESHPHESFKIYGGEVDTCTDAEVKYDKSFDEQYECNKIFFWERVDIDSFNKFIDERLGKNRDNTYPYAWAGWSKKGSLVIKIKKFSMKLSTDACEFKEPSI